MLTSHLWVMVTSLLVYVSTSTAYILVYDDTYIAIAELKDEDSNVGRPVPNGGIEGTLVDLAKHDACHAIKSAPSDNSTYLALVTKQPEDGCSYGMKMMRVKNAGYSAALYYEEDDQAVAMAIDDLADDQHSYHDSLYAPSVVLKAKDAHLLQRRFPAHKGYTVGVYPEKRHRSILFVLYILYGIIAVFIIMWTVVMVRFCYTRIKRRPKHLTAKKLKKIPVVVFLEGDPYDVCAICLEDYVEGDKLRLLPCTHAYHKECVDPWLLTKKCVCPLCKKTVIPEDGATGRLEDESGEETDDDQAALLQGPSNSAESSSNTDAVSGGCDNADFWQTLSRASVHRTLIDLDDPDQTHTSPQLAPPGEHGRTSRVDNVTPDMFTAGGNSFSDSHSWLVSIPCEGVTTSSSPLFPDSSRDVTSWGGSQSGTANLTPHQDYFSVNGDNHHGNRRPVNSDQETEQSVIWENCSVHGRVV